MNTPFSEEVLERIQPILRTSSFRPFSLVLILIMGLASFMYPTGTNTNSPPSGSAPSVPLSTKVVDQRPDKEWELQAGVSKPLNTTPVIDANSQTKDAGETLALQVPDTTAKQAVTIESEVNEILQTGRDRSEDLPVTEAVTEKQDTAVTSEKPVTESYIKISYTGEELPTSATQWACVEDQNTGLVWEVKTAEGGLHNKNNLYSWYEPLGNSKVAGVAGGGRCDDDTDCDAHTFVQALNAVKYCGYSDWRLPTRDEVQTIVVVGNGKADTINRDYFPHGLASWYWTATTNQRHPEYAWYLLFRNGITLSDLKARPKHLRLVRSDNLAR